MTFLNGHALNSRRLLLGALLGMAALSLNPGQASAQIPSLDAINAVGNMLGIGQPPRERPNMDIMNGNLHSNDLNFCVLTCDLPSNLIPSGPSQARPPMPPQARPPMPPQARPPVPSQAPRPQGPTILIPPITL